MGQGENSMFGLQAWDAVTELWVAFMASLHRAFPWPPMIEPWSLMVLLAPDSAPAALQATPPLQASHAVPGFKPSRAMLLTWSSVCSLFLTARSD